MQSEQINELAAALAKAQGQITGALKDSNNPFFKSKYADLASCWDACRKQLSDNGLAVVQTTYFADGQTFLNTILTHSSGQWISGSLPIKAKDDGPQAQGSGITYSRRYALAAIVGLAQIDDDAEAAQGRVETGRKIAPMPDSPNLTDRDKADVQSFINSFVDALNADVDEDEKASMIFAVREEANKRQDLFVEAWKGLDSKQRSAIKKYIDIANKRKAA